MLTKIAGKTPVNLLLGESKSSLSSGHILITVPGFLKSKLMDSRKVSLDLSALKMIVYDEADELLLQESNLVCFEALQKYLKKIEVKPQHCLFSATFSDQVIEVAKALIGDYKAFPIKKEALKLKGVRQFKLRIDAAARTDFIANLHSKLNRAMTMVFVNKKDTASKLQKRLAQQEIAATILTGDIEKDERDRIIDRYRENEFSTLISTNVLARGIDVPEVDLVINFDVPMIKLYGFKEPDYANYMHRVGRTGRFGTDGVALTLMNEEEDPELMELIARHYEIEITQLQNFDELEAILDEMRGNLYNV